MFSTLFHNHQGLLLFCQFRALLVFHFPFAHGCDHAQIFCAHGLIHAHRKSRVIGVRMAMCTSKPIIGKDAPWVFHLTSAILVALGPLTHLALIMLQKIIVAEDKKRGDGKFC